MIRKNKKDTREDGRIGLTLAGLGLSHVKDTFVGNEQIRGVSGGQRRRVTREYFKMVYICFYNIKN